MVYPLWTQMQLTWKYSRYIVNLLIIIENEPIGSREYLDEHDPRGKMLREIILIKII
jgi:hypothetical protein